jgi:hypothetical protein
VKKAMAKSDGAVARLSGRFPPGMKVGLYRGRIDGVLRDDTLRGAFKQATVNKRGEVEFTGLDDDERLFIAGVVESEARPGEPSGTVHKDWRSVAIHASIPTTEKKQTEKEIQTALATTLSAHEQEPDRTTVGARNTRSLSSQGQPFANTQVGKPTPGGPPQHPSPRLRQEDVDDVEQRTATITGGAFPVDPDEPVPAPKQDGPVDLEQRIATGVGQLHPIPAGEFQPGVPQSGDDPREQRIATSEGTQFPLPEGDPVDHTRRRDSSLAKVVGGAVEPVKKAVRARSQKRKARSAKKGTAKRRGARSTSSGRKSKPRTEAQKKARRERDRKRRAK